MKKVFLALVVILAFSCAAEAVYQNPNGPVENSSIIQGTYQNPNSPSNISQESYTPTELPANGSGSFGGGTGTGGQDTYQNPNGQYQTGQQNPETVVQEIPGSSSNNSSSSSNNATGNNGAPENPAGSSTDGKFGNILILIAVLAIILAVGYIYYRKSVRKGDDEDAVLRRLKEQKEN